MRRPRTQNAAASGSHWENLKSMERQTTIGTMAVLASVCAVMSAAAYASGNVAPGWDPDAFRKESTLQIMTTGPEEGEHWSRLWLVVIDGQMYIRLGDRAFGRVQKNTTSPYVKVKVLGKEFDRVRLDASPEMADKVAAAMAEKYFLDILVRHESHPMTARLTAEAAPAPKQ